MFSLEMQKIAPGFSDVSSSSTRGSRTTGYRFSKRAFAITTIAAMCVILAAMALPGLVSAPSSFPHDLHWMASIGSAGESTMLAVSATGLVAMAAINLSKKAKNIEFFKSKNDVKETRFASTNLYEEHYRWLDQGEWLSEYRSIFTEEQPYIGMIEGMPDLDQLHADMPNLCYRALRWSSSSETGEKGSYEKWIERPLEDYTTYTLEKTMIVRKTAEGKLEYFPVYREHYEAVYDYLDRNLHMSFWAPSV